MLKYIKNSEIDRKKWDECIKNSKNGLIYAYSWYLDSYSKNWNALIYEDYLAVFPISLSGKVIIKFFNPLFASQLGLFYSNEKGNDLLNNFISKIPKNISIIDIQLNYDNKYVSSKYKTEKKYCQFIELNKSYEEISSNFSKNLKRILKKHDGLTFKYSENLNSLIELYNKDEKNKILNKNEQHLYLLKSSLNSIIQNSSYKIVECYKENILLASAFFSFSNNRIIYMKGASNYEGRKYNAMHFIMAFMINKYSNSNLIFDFGGSSAENVRKFNLHFTKNEYSYQRIYKNNLIYNLRLLIRYFFK